MAAFQKNRDMTVHIFDKNDVDQSSSSGDVTVTRCMVTFGEIILVRSNTRVGLDLRC